MEEYSLNNLQKKKKHKLNSSTEQYPDSNVNTSEDGSFTKLKKKRRKEKDYSLEREATVEVEANNDNNFSESKKTYKYSKIESFSDVDRRKKKKIKIESDIQNNNDYNDNNVSELSDDRHKKKKKKKHRETETLESLNGNFNDGEALSTDEKIAKEESKKNSDCVMGIYDDNSPSIKRELDTLSIKTKKKKKKKEKIDESDVRPNRKVEDIIVDNQLQYTNSQLSDIDYSTDNIDVSNKKKKKKKHRSIEIENALSDDLSHLKTEGEVKVQVKSKVQDSNTNVKNETHQESSYNSATELHSKKAKKSHKRYEYDEDKSNINTENQIKSKKNKHKKEAKNEEIPDSFLEEKNNIQVSDDLEYSQNVKSKKKKKKKHEIDVVEDEADTKNTELRQKKKKKKKYCEEVIQEESEPMDIDFGHVASDQGNMKEDHIDNHSHKKKKKHKCQKEAIEVEDKTDYDSPKTRCENMEIILQKESSIGDKINKQPEESSGFESEEGDYSESERVPRISKTKPSIFIKYPKLARILQDSDSDDNYPHLQHRKMTLAEAVKLSELEIQLRHEPLPQHQIERYPGTCTLTLDEKKKFMEHCELKSGRFDHQEDQRIVHNWKKFCKTHGWKRSIIYPFLHQTKKGFFYVASIEGRKKFVQFLAKGLPNRSLYSVYTRFRNLYATHKTTRYTKEEDEVILSELKDQHGRNRFSTVARKLNRTRASVWRRYKLLLAKKKENSDNEDEVPNESVV